MEDAVSERGKSFLRLTRTSGTEQLRISDDYYGGVGFVSARIWKAHPDGWIPSRTRGITFRRSELPCVIAALHLYAEAYGINLFDSLEEAAQAAEDDRLPLVEVQGDE